MQNTGVDTVDALVPGQKLAAQLRRDVHDLGAVPTSRAIAGLKAVAVADGMTGSAAEQQAQAVVSALMACGDLGSGKSYGDRVLVKRRSVAVLVQGGRCVLLGGDPLQGEAHGLLRSTDLIPSDVTSFLDWVGEVSEADIARLWQVLDAGVWPLGEITSDAATRLLCGAGIVPEQPIAGEASAWLREYFPLPRTGESAADPSQTAVIERPSSARQIVTAGPGSGKTHTATERVIHLVKQGVPPAGIRLITFTRVAAEEVGRRVSSALAEFTYSGGVTCGTIDSLAWNLVTTLGNAPRGGHERIIRVARKAVSDGEQAMLDLLAGISHLVIDEAQDIVGERRVFCRALIDALPESVGVTILGDGAQAIYGTWAGDKESSGSLHAELRDLSGWENRSLTANHRTKSLGLRQFFGQARALLESDSDPRATYLEIRGMLEEVATDANVSLTGPVFPWRDDSLILFRGRAATEAASVRLTRSARVHRLKLSGQTSVCDPLVGAICAGHGSGAAIRLEHVRRRLADLHPAPLGLIEEDVLADLQSLGNGHTPRLQDIADAVEREPVGHTRDHVGTAGPLLGSIHGAKGREASNVLLMLPPVPIGDDVDWLEEARVLFVGATRASTHLYLGKAQPGLVRPGKNGSRWLRGNGGGLLLSGSEGLRALDGLAPALSVWEAGFRQPNCSFRRVGTGEETPWHLVTDGGDLLAQVDGLLTDDLDHIEATRGGLAPGTLRVVGATTVVDRRKDGRIQAVTLLPVLQGVVQGTGKRDNQVDQ
ncbi:UvrD-helicase domain-containing protein [Tropicibacter oceani]|uniref:DNA 3'-5' helicase II n=1 Tax=Tropicibacter oceani TaxID=3058420 RepID=A0ABY8QMC5_9RHOB|nr:UvrD-helicase domain-containing protein [Tropicibacter oceani]WGW05088.1 AAA family ATPase [Tropicibacter oceani]